MRDVIAMVASLLSTVRWGESLRAQSDKASEYHAVHLRLPQTQSLLAFDWVSPTLVGDVCYPTDAPDGLNDCRAMLWQFALLRQVEESLGIKRDYMLLAKSPGRAELPGVEVLRNEASAFGIIFHVVTSADQAAKYLLQHA